MMKPRTRARSAFSLLELVIVIGIIVVLSALLFSAMRSIRERGNEATCLAHMRKLSVIVMQYSAENNSRLLPAASGASASVNDKVWYMILSEAGYIEGDPLKVNNAGRETWAGLRNSFMACPNRSEAPSAYWIKWGKHDLHYSVNQNPGFMNRVNTSTGPRPTLGRIANPGRTFLLAESTYALVYPNGDYAAYPHPRPSGDLSQGQGMNLIFYDGHAEKLKSRMPVLPGTFVSVPYDTLSPEQSFPWW